MKAERRKGVAKIDAIFHIEIKTKKGLLLPAGEIAERVANKIWTTTFEDLHDEGILISHCKLLTKFTYPEYTEKGKP